MFIIGKIIGAICGALLFGPIGALFGLWIGHFFDRGVQTHLHPHQQVQTTFFNATFAVMGHIAKADGRVSENEIELAKQIMASWRLRADLKEKAIAQFRYGKSEQFNLNKTLAELYQACHGYRALLALFAEIQMQTAQADGMTTEKKNILKNIYRQLRLDFFEKSSKQYYQKATTATQPDPYTVLGVSTTASKDEIKHAYRKLMSQNHPDKLVAKGLPPEMIKLATEKTQSIQAAYEQLK